MREPLVAREHMVEAHLLARGIHDRRVLDAFRSVRRERYVPFADAHRAYDDAPLGIGDEQTISQPYVVALMAEALGLRGGERVLDVGTGSGYAAAILARLAKEVISIERIPRLAREASARLASEGVTNVRVMLGDGSRGAPEYAPYDAIVVAAAAPAVPRDLLLQLAVGGKLIVPVGRNEGEQRLVKIAKTAEGKFTEEILGDVRFVPLIEGAPAS